MRNASLAVRVVVLVAVFSVSAIGQQPSPAVFIYSSTAIDMPVEPVRLRTVMTLADAAKHNDFPTFDAMYASSSQRDAAAFAELHSFWKWSLTDPVGAFYGDELHARLAAEYSDYAEFIADYGIIDSRGRAFYPSAETRTFLLRKATAGRSALIAQEVAPEAVDRATIARLAVDENRMSSPAERPLGIATAPVAPKKLARKAIVKRHRATLAQPIVSAVAVTRRIDVPKLVATPDRNRRLLLESEARGPRPEASPVITAPKPRLITATRPHLVAPARAHVRPADGRLGRGLVLIFAGLIGLGLLSLMLSVPDEATPEAQEHADSMDAGRMIRIDEKPARTA